VKKLRFSKSQRLVSNSQIKAVLGRRLRYTDGLLVLYMAENTCGYPRLGVSVGRSCGKAVIRNRLKRLLRDAFRLDQDWIPTEFDYVLMVLQAGLRQMEKGGNGLTLSQVRRSFEGLIRKAVGRQGLSTRGRSIVDDRTELS